MTHVELFLAYEWDCDNCGWLNFISPVMMSETVECQRCGEEYMADIPGVCPKCGKSDMTFNGKIDRGNYDLVAKCNACGTG